jgi:[citrate (pro-3S)-lyase] ligase
MKKTLPLHGVEVVEIDRVEKGGKAVSASRVRELLAGGRLDEIRELVPETTFEFLRNRS